MKTRNSIGYVINVDGTRVTVNLFDVYKGSAVGHSCGISEATEIGTLLAIDAGTKVLVFKVEALSFAEPKDVHRTEIISGAQYIEPLRNMIGTIVGSFQSDGIDSTFLPSTLVTPPLGAEVYPLVAKELSTIFGKDKPSVKTISIGRQLKSGDSIHVNVKEFLTRHIAVLGGTGQGKSCFTASILQQLVQLPNPRIVIFDINGEYEDAFKSDNKTEKWVKITRIGNREESDNTFRIPYYALGRLGLQRLFMTSEKTQRPALNFALENLDKVEWISNEKGLGLVGENQAKLFDDCRPINADIAYEMIETLQKGKAICAQEWPPMEALGALIAESHSLLFDKGKYKRDSFLYGNVFPLITRIRRLIEDKLFTAVVDVNGSKDKNGDLNWQKESGNLVEEFFGGTEQKWKVHIVNLREISHDLSPFILGSLLDLYANELFNRGQNNNYPTMLVLEEAHHYLRNIGTSEEDTMNTIAYERLAKEGRKFGLALWLSTQRPSEISSTVLSQCNNWVCFRLTSERDLSKVLSANEWANRKDVNRIAGLSRRQALVFGGSLKLPLLFEPHEAYPLPMSRDAPFEKWWEISDERNKTEFPTSRT